MDSELEEMSQEMAGHGPEVMSDSANWQEVTTAAQIQVGDFTSKRIANPASFLIADLPFWLRGLIFPVSDVS